MRLKNTWNTPIVNCPYCKVVAYSCVAACKRCKPMARQSGKALCFVKLPKRMNNLAWCLSDHALLTVVTFTDARVRAPAIHAVIPFGQPIDSMNSKSHLFIIELISVTIEFSYGNIFISVKSWPEEIAEESN